MSQNGFVYAESAFIKPLKLMIFIYRFNLSSP